MLLGATVRAPTGAGPGQSSCGSESAGAGLRSVNSSRGPGTVQSGRASQGRMGSCTGQRSSTGGTSSPGATSGSVLSPRPAESRKQSAFLLQIAEEEAELVRLIARQDAVASELLQARIEYEQALEEESRMPGTVPEDANALAEALSPPSGSESSNLLNLEDETEQQGQDQKRRSAVFDLMQYFEELAEAGAPMPKQAEEAVRERGPKARLAMQGNRRDESERPGVTVQKYDTQELLRGIGEHQKELNVKVPVCPGVANAGFGQCQTFEPTFALSVRVRSRTCTFE